jgi:hypothetical protein
MADAQPHPASHPIDRLIGTAPAVAALRAQIRHLAAFDAVGSPHVPTVLLRLDGRELWVCGEIVAGSQTHMRLAAEGFDAAPDNSRCAGSNSSASHCASGRTGWSKDSDGQHVGITTEP